MKGLMMVSGIVVLILGVLALVPMVFLWAVNTLAASGGSDFYIPHGLWTYFVSLVLLMLVNGDAAK